jgi:hypothetical protein
MSSASLCRRVDCDALDLTYAAGLFVLRFDSTTCIGVNPRQAPL